MESHEIKEGLSVRAGIINGGKCKGTIIKLTSDELLIEISQLTAPLDKLPVTLMIGTPRPQAVKRVIQTATLCGVTEIVFLKTDNTVNSYLQSKELMYARYSLEIIKSLEQSCDTIPPAVKTAKNLINFIDAIDGNANKILSDSTGIKIKDLKFNDQTEDKYYLAIGPELGWSEREKDYLKTKDFIAINLGERILRVDTAVAVALGQMMGALF